MLPLVNPMKALTTSIALAAAFLAVLPAERAMADEPDAAPRIRPLPPIDPYEGLHDFRLSVAEGYGWTKSRSHDLPDSRRDVDHYASLKFGIGEKGFASIGGTYTRQWGNTANSPANGSNALIETTPSLQGQIAGGYRILPYLSVGAAFNWGYNWGHSIMPGTPTVDLGGHGTAVSPFVMATLPKGDWTFSALTSYTNGHGRQTYTNNTPNVQETFAETTSLLLGADYHVTSEWKIGADATWMHTLAYDAGDFELGQPRNWSILGINTGYDLTRDLALTLRGSAWLNDRYSRQQIIVGLSYKL